MSLAEGQKALQTFNEWCDAQGIEYDREALEIRAFVDGSSANQNRYHYAVFARRDIADGDVVVRSIPKRACLSARTSSCAPQLRAERLGGGLALNIAIMHERSLGELSAWHGYFAVLPDRGERTLPMFWPERALRALRGTELAAHVAADAVSLREDYDEHVVEGLCVSFPEVFDPGRYRTDRGFELYLEAASLAASRAFFIGDVFGEALVPVADAFNHRTDAESVRVFGADAEAGDETSDEEESGDRSSQSSGDASSASLPSIEPYDAPVTGALEIHARGATRAGDELFNTFGVQNDASLLHKYGFCERDNAHCTVGLDVKLVERAIGADAARTAAEAVGLDLDEEGYFEVAPDGGVEDALLALLARARRREGEEDDPTSESPEVRAALADVLRLRLEAYGGDARLDRGAQAERTTDHTDGGVARAAGGRAPAGGGATGAEAAETLRAAEMAVLAAALRAAEGETLTGGGKRRKR